jgi:23S rRNA pseudouridine1911/1915/1917 synthase
MSAEEKPQRRADVPAAHHGQRLDRVLTELLGGGLSRSQVTRRLREGLVRLDGRIVRRGGLPVQEGQRLEMDDPEEAAAEDFVPPGILHQDEFLVVLDKPAGLPMHGNYVGDRRPSVARFLEERFGPGLPTNQGAERPGIVHRLDKQTSGVCVAALEQSAFLDLMQQFADRVVEKEYEAVCYGSPRFRSDWVDQRLARDEKRPERVRTTRSTGPESRDALTYWEVLRRFEGFAHLRAKPHTGRMHQIRVHLASIDLPIVGDPLYRARNFGPGMFPPGAPAVTRTLLHARRLCFEHPATGESATFEAPLPEDLAAFLACLEERLPAPQEDPWT